MSESLDIVTLTEPPSGEDCRELASFLAHFARTGQLDLPFPGDDDPEVWNRRMHWWWHDNPFVEEGTPLAYVMRTASGKLAGFHGFIPYGYEAGGERVPTLIATTFFVDEPYRSHSMKIFLKLNRLGRDYQILDGSPTTDMREILKKFGYEARPEVERYQILVRRPGLALKARLMQLAKLGRFIGEVSPDENLRVISSPAEIGSIPEPAQDEGVLRRSVTREGLQWLTNSGSWERSFFGLVDEGGELQAYFIGLMKRVSGVTACRLLEYSAFNNEDSILTTLVSFVANRPDESGLPSNVDLLLWSAFEGALTNRPSMEPRVRPAVLHFKLPDHWKEFPKTCLPCEGDVVLL